MKQPLGETENHFVKAIEHLRQHNGRAYHQQAVVELEEFMNVMTNKRPSIQQQLDQQLMKQILTNRIKIRSIVETIVLCGRQNIPLRGH